MMLLFSQSTGEIELNDECIAVGWAGNGLGKCNPEMQHVPCVGPLPRGFYTIDPWEDQHEPLGPIIAHLIPDPSNEMFGRDDFFIHGPSSTHWGQESKGCIVVPHDQRVVVRDTGETRLQVIR